jgi:AcrR family transcriptional regulator
MPKPKSRTRETLLQAAVTVVSREGPTGLTLDAVAREAGVSKGGLLYHFPSKDALLRGLISEFMAAFNRRVDELMNDDPDRMGSWSRAYWRATVEFEQVEALNALLASSMLNMEVTDDLQQHFLHWRQCAERDGLDPATAALVSLASDGYLFLGVHRMGPIDSDARSKVTALIETLTRPARK